MSYSRWGRDSVWYAFYAGEGTLALWSGTIRDWAFKDLFLMSADRIKEIYEESDEDCVEAIDYVQSFQLDWIMERLGPSWIERKNYGIPVALTGSAYMQMHNYMLLCRV
jgi:hypothetical protein